MSPLPQPASQPRRRHYLCRCDRLSEPASEPAVKPDKRLLCLLGALAVIAHAIGLFSQLTHSVGLGLDFFNSASLIAASVIVVTLIATSRIPVENLLVLLFPLGMVTVLLAQFAPSGTVQPIMEEPGILSHILLSLLAYGMFTIAAFRALLLLLQDYRLKHKHPSGLIKNFPPLQTMESLLFGFLWAGWSLLSLSLISGWLFVENLFAQHLVHKTLLACLARIVFSVLLWGVTVLDGVDTRPFAGRWAVSAC